MTLVTGGKQVIQLKSKCFRFSFKA